MKRQRCFITLETGAVLVFEGVYQFDPDKPIKIRKVGFTRPHYDRAGAADDALPRFKSEDDFFNYMLGKLEGKGKR